MNAKQRYQRRVAITAGERRIYSVIRFKISIQTTMTITMQSDEKSQNVITPVIFQQPQDTKPNKTKKYALIGLSLLLALGLVVTAILVGIHMYNKAQIELMTIRYKITLDGGNRWQDVEGNRYTNVVKTHVKDDEREAYIVDDFNTEIKVTKIIKRFVTNCYITALNMSNALTPDKISRPADADAYDYKPTSSVPILYQTNGHPVQDISFLSKEARDMCKGVSTYWMYPSCGSNLPNAITNQTQTHRKREAPYYVTFNRYVDGVLLPCINGCCNTVCACNIDYYWVLSNGTMSCRWIYQACCPQIIGKCPLHIGCDATPGLNCSANATVC